MTRQPKPASLFTPWTTVAALLAVHPEAAVVFIRRSMACVGCPLSRFDSLADAARAYGVPIGRFLRELAAAVVSTPSPCARAKYSGAAG
jgi:hybrid cluster-associated redox disulfide protein